jgi:hypothetical protein
MVAGPEAFRSRVDVRSSDMDMEPPKRAYNYLKASANSTKSGPSPAKTSKRLPDAVHGSPKEGHFTARFAGGAEIAERNCFFNGGRYRH